MDKKKQIEEMAKVLCQNVLTEYCASGSCSNSNCLVNAKALYTLYNAGYRKASEVAREIFEEIEASAKVKYWRGGGLVVFEVNGEDFAELKKKYTESEDTE